MAESDPIKQRYKRVRLIQFVVAEALLLGGLALVFREIPGTIFWPLTTGLIVPLVFLEPNFTPLRGALASAAAQIGSVATIDRGSQQALWTALIVISSVVAVSALVAIYREEKTGQLFHWLATRLGRAAVLGSVVSVILILQVAGIDMRDASGLTGLLLALYAVLFLDWARLTLSPSRLNDEAASVTALYGPNQILVRSFARLSAGDQVQLSGDAGARTGYVAEHLASARGSQYRVILDGDWRDVASVADSPCILTQATDESAPLRGFAIERSTESTLHVSPVDDLVVGETVELEDAHGPLLYQVAGLRLQEETWSGGAAIVPRADLVQVGTQSADGHIVKRPSLPKPYAPVRSVSDSAGGLPDGFMRLGRLKGTEVPVGMQRDWAANDGHLAILGMSGMGKTTAAAKLAGLATGEQKLTILDETSEYRTRLGFAPVAPRDVDWEQGGVAVCEPAGELAVECEKVIFAAMEAAQKEYARGDEPRRRFILLEEAHGWLPEWNFATRTQQEAVNKSCRYILQARKFNMTFVMVSQRTAVISKSALSQCENYIILRTLDQTSLDYIEGVVGSDMRRVVTELGRYEAICVGPLFNSDGPVIVTLDPAGASES